MGKIVLIIDGRSLHCIDPDMFVLAQESGIIIWMFTIAFHPLSPSPGPVILDTSGKLFLHCKTVLVRFSRSCWGVHGRESNSHSESETCHAYLYNPVKIPEGATYNSRIDKYQSSARNRFKRIPDTPASRKPISSMTISWGPYFCPILDPLQSGGRRQLQFWQTSSI
jgi:hypothetical protein